jgi:CheY-like chemotaxis protein
MTKTVLIVDDDLSIHKTLEYILKQHNITSLHANTGVEALKLLKTNVPDMIFMDFKLPGPNGIKVTRKIKNSSRFKKTPIIGITAYASPENQEIARSVGIETILSKPFELIDIQKIINDYLS